MTGRRGKRVPTCAPKNAQKVASNRSPWVAIIRCKRSSSDVPVSD